MALAGIELDRKSLAELAIREPEGFTEIVKAAQSAL
jgi:ribosomal protein L20|tara:strand:- start:87 stop:194 length:108 start_codon:yes stop_codon:yes gene_type:complete